MTTLIAAIILIGSFLGIGLLVYRKIPLLLNLPELLIEEETLISRLKTKIKEKNPFKNFSYVMFLQKTLMRIRILTLKTDNKTFKWLSSLKKKNEEKKNKDNYWEEIKKIKN